MVLNTAAEKQGKIVVLLDLSAPYQEQIVREIEAGATAVVVYRDRNGTPGQGMYYIKQGFNESRINMPVIEAFESFKAANSLKRHLSSTSTIQVSIWPQENLWKKANDVIAFQIVCNVILSSMQVAIIVIGIIRLAAWFHSTSSSLISIGPVCIVLEMISAILRSAQTFVDPFLTFRTMPTPPSSNLITSPLPFQFAAGILLSFYWAETLNRSKLKTTPFISEYKRSAIAVIIVLFLGEIITSAIRITIPITGTNVASYITEVFYVIVAAGLTASYAVCAYQTYLRLSTSGVSSSSRAIRNLTLRILISTSGYVLFIILAILLVPFYGNPWGWKIVLNTMFFAENVTGVLQVYSFIPPDMRRTSSSASRSAVKISNRYTSEI